MSTSTRPLTQAGKSAASSSRECERAGDRRRRRHHRARAPAARGGGGFPRLTRALAPVLGSNTGRKPMPRLRYIEDSEQSPHTRELIESARRTGAPDPRVVSLMTRSPLGIAWVEYWNKLLYQGVLPHKLKEMCRIKISVAHQCGYCSTVRSTVAKAQGLTEDMISDLFDYAGSTRFSEREKAALHYADLFKQGELSIDKDEVYADLARHFSDELGLFCAEVDGVGK